MAYTLITANRNYSSWSLRPWVLMKALGIDFEDRMETFSEGSNFEEFRKFNPAGMVPCLIDDGRTVWDSLAIIEYLAERHDGVWPNDEDARAWARCAAAEMHSGFSTVRNRCPMNVGVRANLLDINAALVAEIDRLKELWKEGLDCFGGPYLAGDKFTAVDAFFAPVAYRVRTFSLDVGVAGKAWVDHMIAYPAMAEWEQAALIEPYREIGHEEELAATATVTADHRIGR